MRGKLALPIQLIASVLIADPGAQYASTATPATYTPVHSANQRVVPG